MLLKRRITRLLNETSIKSKIVSIYVCSEENLCEIITGSYLYDKRRRNQKPFPFDTLCKINIVFNHSETDIDKEYGRVQSNGQIWWRYRELWQGLFAQQT